MLWSRAYYWTKNNKLLSYYKDSDTSQQRHTKSSILICPWLNIAIVSVAITVTIEQQLVVDMKEQSQSHTYAMHENVHAHPWWPSFVDKYAINLYCKNKCETLWCILYRHCGSTSYSRSKLVSEVDQKVVKNVHSSLCKKYLTIFIPAIIEWPMNIWQKYHCTVHEIWPRDSINRENCALHMYLCKVWFHWWEVIFIHQ